MDLGDQRLTINMNEALLSHRLTPTVAAEYSDKAKEAAEFLSRITNKDLLKNRPNGMRPILDVTDSGRAHAQPWNHSIFMDPDDSVAVYIHEIGHLLEAEIDDLTLRAKEFVAARINRSGTTAKKFVDEFPDAGFGIKEIGNEDSFGTSFWNRRSAMYVGKDYDPSPYTELISMSVEQMRRDPVAFATEQPELFKFVIGALRGNIK
jgi:hypothetical protein